MLTQDIQLGSSDLMRGLGLGLIPRPPPRFLSSAVWKSAQGEPGNEVTESCIAVLFRTRLALYQSGLGMRLERDTMVNIVQ